MQMVTKYPHEHITRWHVAVIIAIAGMFLMVTAPIGFPYAMPDPLPPSFGTTTNTPLLPAINSQLVAGLIMALVGCAYLALDIAKDQAKASADKCPHCGKEL
jgi:hypothetical protein